MRERWSVGLTGLDERHLLRLIRDYVDQDRIHDSLEKDTLKRWCDPISTVVLLRAISESRAQGSCDPKIARGKGSSIFPPQGCCSSDTASKQQDAEGARHSAALRPPGRTLGRVSASQGSRLGQDDATTTQLNCRALFHCSSPPSGDYCSCNGRVPVIRSEPQWWAGNAGKYCRDLSGQLLPDPTRWRGESLKTRHDRTMSTSSSGRPNETLAS